MIRDLNTQSQSAIVPKIWGSHRFQLSVVQENVDGCLHLVTSAMSSTGQLRLNCSWKRKFGETITSIGFGTNHYFNVPYFQPGLITPSP